MEFFVGTLTREGGKGLLRCNLEEEKIVELEALSLTDPSYALRRITVSCTAPIMVPAPFRCFLLRAG